MPDTVVHPTSEIGRGAKIGAGTKVWHWSHIMQDAEIGENCVIGQGVFIGRGVKIGDGCKIQNGVSVFQGVTLQDHVFVGPYAVFTNVLTPRAEIDRHGQFVETLVQTGATIGANATIICGGTLGRYCFVAAGAVVTAQKVPDHTLMVGIPARAKGFACKCGVTLDHQGTATVVKDLAQVTVPKFTCPACKKRYYLFDELTHA